MERDGAEDVRVAMLWVGIAACPLRAAGAGGGITTPPSAAHAMWCVETATVADSLSY